MEQKKLQVKPHLPTPVLLILLLCVIVSSCANSSEPRSAVATITTDTTEVKVPASGPERMSLLASEWKTMTDSFPKHFRLVGGAAIKNIEVEIPWNELTAKLPASNGTERGVLFHYGLKNGEFRLGLTFIELKSLSGSNDEFEYPAHQSLLVYPVVNGKLGSGVVHSVWKRDFLSAPLPSSGRYFGSVEVRRSDGPTYERVQIGSDPELEMMPYEQEILRLFDENDPKDDRYKLSLVITCAADHVAELGGYAHKLCLHMRQRSVDPLDTAVIDLLDNSGRTTGAEFKMHAGDLGSLCPPLCRRYTRKNALIGI